MYINMMENKKKISFSKLSYTIIRSLLLNHVFYYVNTCVKMHNWFYSKYECKFSLVRNM